MPEEPDTFYVTTPIYYVNARPHIGHVYTTTIADILARYHRLRGDDTFFLTGTDEHAAKVVAAAAERGLGPREWADQNAAAFQETFARLGISNDDFVRTSQPRHIQKVTAYFRDLTDTGDVYAGEYEGWYDAGQEEYIPENKAKEYEYRSPITGRPLIRKREKNYFFRLSRYQDELLGLIERGEFVIEPEARKNEIVARIREGLNDAAISRTGTGGWGIPIPDDPEQTIYVWIDALFSYLSTVDTDERRGYWPADVHLIGKEILWFHAVIWPALLCALKRPLPKRVYAHSFWIAEGQKMSKSLGNFIGLEQLDDVARRFGLDALRYFLATQGPMGTTDADFSEAKFIENYNADLANTLGNCFSRVANMTARYFGGRLPDPGPPVRMMKEGLSGVAGRCVSRHRSAMESLQPDEAAAAALGLISEIDSYIEQTQPFKLAKQKEMLPEVGTILYNCAEAMRIASLLLWPVMPGRIEELWRRIDCGWYAEVLADRGRGQLGEWTSWGYLRAGTPVTKGDALFPRYRP